MSTPDPADPLLVNVAELWLREPKRRAADDVLHVQRQRQLTDHLTDALDAWTSAHPLDAEPLVEGGTR